MDTNGVVSVIKKPAVQVVHMTTELPSGLGTKIRKMSGRPSKPSIAKRPRTYIALGLIGAFGLFVKSLFSPRK